ncbi:molybdate ABC transporter permease subunit [Altericista sp. CCNU0014]|uniref:molybdate ABC transporter permease subunit n=1 Tax=Altericista sp. CCNU0014 TaxID=3082949 RepID=UPI00384DFCBD
MPSDLSPLWISLKTASLATLITFGLGLAAAYWMLGYRGKGRSPIEGLFISSLILPPTVVGFVLLLLLGKNGPLGQLLPADWAIVFTWYAAVVTATVVAFPLMYKTALGAFEQIDANLLRAARTLGASEVEIFWRITFPLALPGILAGTTLAFARALGEFGATLMLAGNIPGQTQTIPMAIYFAVEGGAFQDALFWSLVIIGISLSGIIGANFWQGRRRSAIERPFTSGPRTRLKPSLAKDSGSPARNDASLTVDIRKQLADFDLEVAFAADQQTLGLLGASGAGKSLILRCIAGIETPTTGRIVLNGRVLFDARQGINIPSRDRRIGFLFQNYALFPHLTVAQNIAFGLPKGLPKASIKQEVAAQLVAVQLEELGQRYPHQLSGGQQQRVALARALASRPEALLLDEPFSALDTHLRDRMEKLTIANLASYQGVSLFVTHNLEEAYRVCEELLVLEGGRAIAQEPKHRIFEHPQTVSVAQLTGCKNFSRARVRDACRVEAVDWGCTLEVIEAIPERLVQVGIRAHQIVFLEAPGYGQQSLPTSAIQGFYCEEARHCPSRSSDAGEAETGRTEVGDRADLEGRKPLPPNIFDCWLAGTSETPHRMTLFLKILSEPNHPSDYHLQAEVFKEKWVLLKDRPSPWRVHLDPMRLLLLEE